MKFRLTNPHYLRLVNKEHFFEQKETPLGSNEAVTHRMRVDTYLHPQDPTQWNWDPENNRYKKPGTFRVALGEEGWLVLTNKKEGHPYELIYTGPLTTEMDGMDPEATKALEAIKNGYMHPMGEGAFPATGSRSGATDELAAANARIAELEARLRQPAAK